MMRTQREVVYRHSVINFGNLKMYIYIDIAVSVYSWELDMDICYLSVYVTNLKEM